MAAGLYQCLLNVSKQVLAVFQSHADAYGCVCYRHFSTLLVGELSEDGAGGMYGQRLAVEEIGGTAYHLQFVDECIALIF